MTNPLPDPRPALELTMGQIGDTIAGLSSADLDVTTACPGWTVRDIVAHLVAVVERIDELATGHIATGPPPHPEHGDSGWPDAWQHAVEGYRSRWADDRRLTEMMHPPFGTMPGAAMLWVYVTELTTHHWDIADVIGRAPMWDDEVVGAAYASTVAGLPAEGRDVPGFPFDPVVDVADDAPVIDRLVAYLGRRPASAVVTS